MCEASVRSNVMHRLTLSFLVLCGICVNAAAQSTDSLYQDMLYYGDVMVNAARPESRTRAETGFYNTFREYLKSGGTDMQDIPWVRVVIPADSLFDLITWQVEEKEEFRYRGFIRFRETGEVLALNDTRKLNSEYAAYLPGQWYGALYYGIEPFKDKDGRTLYMVLGFNAYTPQVNQRVADILIVDGAQTRFGAELLWADTLGTELKSRQIVEYADAAAATMRFDREKGMLIFDHIIPVDTPEGPAYVPDGSYLGYQLHNGVWELIDKVFTLKMDAPPGGRPKDAVERDLFGKPVEKKYQD